MITRRNIARVVAEFVGTALLTAIILSVTRSQLPIAYFIALAAGLVVLMTTLVLNGVSGAHLNPVITLGLWSVRRFKTLSAVAYIVAQFAGAYAAYLLFTYFVGQSWPDPVNDFKAKILVAEAIGAFVFSLGWAAAVYQRMEIGKFAATISVSLVLAMLIASVGTGTAMPGFVNPAVALGLRSFEWGTYILGPALGAIIGFNLYGLLFAPARELSDEIEHAAVKASEKKK